MPLELLRPQVLGILLPISGAFLVAITAIVAANWRRVRLAELEAALKKDMLDRGLTVDEIERILNASMSGRRAFDFGCRRHWSRV
jgi:hypothetical protein